MQKKLAWISHTVRRDCWPSAMRSPSNGPQAEVWQACGLLTVLCTLLPQRRKTGHQGRLWCTSRQVYVCQHENAIPWTVNCTEENWWFALTPVCKWRSSLAVNWTPNPPALQITAPQLWSSNNWSWDTKMQMRTSMATLKRLRPVWLAKSNGRWKKRKNIRKGSTVKENKLGLLASAQKGLSSTMKARNTKFMCRHNFSAFYQTCGPGML